MLIIRSPGTTQDVTLATTDLSLRLRKLSESPGRRVARSPEKVRSDVAPAPLELLPDYAEERCVGQRSQWKRLSCLADGDDRSAFNMNGSAAVQRQVNWIIGMTRF